MDKKARIELVRAMELIARTTNDENVFDLWLTSGVADGAIKDDTPDEELEYYVEDNAEFADLMDTFLLLMANAYKSGGLYCDNVVSKAG